jgi:thiol-disulfide isomerase/thioredoxin
MCEPRQYVERLNRLGERLRDEVLLKEAKTPPRRTCSPEDNEHLSRCHGRAPDALSAGSLWQPLLAVPRRSVSIVLLTALALAGCGSHAHSAALTRAQINTALAGSPPQLAALHAQANRLLSGGTAAFKSRLAALRGTPVVVNKWASWCEPCQSEFPVFQRVSVTYGRRVAFVGVDGNDHSASARAFLRGFPVTYPSYTDPRQSIADSLEAAAYFPQTVFIDRRGDIVYDHAGPYLSAAKLEQDIRTYVLGASS